ncbi:hypothetical protein FQR65_LT07604 [Abscondita terminalis]|nr:hypothetical protein FQR65_LT07604 [Abscondita terminalis]
MAHSAPLVLRLIASSVTAATRAGKIIRDIMSRGDLGIVEKGKNDLQTEADRSAQRCIMASLAQQYPNILIIGEEGTSNCEVPSDWIVTDCDQSILSQQCPAEYANVSNNDVVIWIDPLDGTAEYTQGLLDHVTVLVGIAVKGKAVGGVIHQPYYNYESGAADSLGRTLWGLVGLGTGGFIPRDPPPGKTILTTTRSHSNNLVNMALDAFHPDDVLRVGGAGHKVLLLMEGKAHAYIFPSKGCKKWDTCAPEAVLTALGGKLTDIHGNSYEYHKDVEHPNSRGVLATARGLNHGLFVDAFTDSILSSKTLLTNSCRLANSLKQYGLMENDVIGIFSENSIRYFEPVLAALYLGCQLTTFSSHYNVSELKHVANLSKPKLLFCSEYTTPTALATITYLSEIPKIIIIDSEDDYDNCEAMNNFISSHVSPCFNVDTFRPVPVDVKQHVAFILYSSGTTGLPKGVMITHYNINALIGITETATYSLTHTTSIGIMPFYHAYGLFVGFSRIIQRTKLVVMNTFDPHVYLSTIQNHKITALNLVPSMAYFLAKSELVDMYNLSSLKTVVCGGAPLSKSIEEALVKRLKIPNIRQGYGMTETTLGVLSHKIDVIGYGSCGTVLPTVSIKIIDVSTGEALGPMETGELCCRGALIMKGYINDIESTQHVIDSDGWLHTGDIAYYDKNGLFYIVDRLKELIKYKGFQVAPAELEATLLEHPDILDAGVVAIPDEKAGELPFAFVVKNPNSNLTENNVVEFFNGKVSVHKKLRGGVKFVEEIPRNPSGKILRRVLRQKVANFRPKL